MHYNHSPELKSITDVLNNEYNFCVRRILNVIRAGTQLIIGTYSR